MFTRAYLYRIHVCNTGTQYMLQLCLHVRTGTQYRYCVPVRNTGMQYMSPVCLHVRTCMRIHVCNTGTQYMLHLCLHVRTGIAYMYAHAYHWARRRGERWCCIGLLCPRPLGNPFREFPGIVMCWIPGGNSQDFFNSGGNSRKFIRVFFKLWFLIMTIYRFNVLQNTCTTAL